VFTLCGCCRRSSAASEGCLDQPQVRPGGELARGSGPLDQPAPPLMTAEPARDLNPAGKRAVTRPVRQRPQPRLPLKIPAPGTTGPPIPGTRIRGRTPRTAHRAAAMLSPGEPPYGLARGGRPVPAAPRRT
jgi:hypothetical protein